MLELFLRCIAAKGRYVHVERGGGDYCIEIEGNALYILFEGSDGAEDWASNFDFLPSKRTPTRRLVSAVKNSFQPASAPYKNMPVKWRSHRGFLKVWRGMRDEIEAAVEKLLYESSNVDRIIVVGYSHGGAMALLAYEDMKYIYGDRYNIFGFGFAAPRVIFGRIPPEVRDRIEGFITVRNANDIVTHVPPRFLGYKNSGEILQIGRRHIYTPIGAHYAFAYVEELKKWEEQRRIDPHVSVWQLDRKKAR